MFTKYIDLDSVHGNPFDTCVFYFHVCAPISRLTIDNICRAYWAYVGSRHQSNHFKNTVSSNPPENAIKGFV